MAFDVAGFKDAMSRFTSGVTIVSGLENKAAIAAPVHAITPGTWLSCVPPRINFGRYSQLSNQS